MKLCFGIFLILLVAICYSLPQSVNNEQPCTLNQNKMIACNYCLCVNGEWGCTKKSCEAENTGCVTGDVITMDGVSCACFDGQYICED